MTWEVPLGERRADTVVGGLFVVECQASPLAMDEWHARTANHNRLGFPVLWLWDIKRLCRKNTLDEAFALERCARPVWVAPELRLCHEESRDVLFVGDKHTIAACQLARLSAREQAVAARSNSFFGPMALRKLAFLPDFDKNARFHFASRNKGLRLVRFANVAER